MTNMVEQALCKDVHVLNAFFYMYLNKSVSYMSRFVLAGFIFFFKKRREMNK